MEAWVFFTIAAAFFQNLRNMIQKSLNASLSAGGAAYTRFAFAFPLSVVYWLALNQTIGQDLTWGLKFWVFVLVGGTCQVAASVFLLRAFTYRSFAVSTVLSKTETLQAALFTIIILAEPVSTAGAIALAISFVGVCFVSLAKMRGRPGEFVASLVQPAALYSLGTGATLGIAAVCYRGAALSLGGEGALYQAATTLMVVLGVQTVQMAAYLRAVEPGQLTKVWQARGKASLTGLSAMLASVGWFTAMAMENVAHVRVVGQVELVFTFFASIFFFRERIVRAEVAGTVLIVIGVAVLLLY